jgi:uncharacterized protein YndB with AHSA1/START domain
MITHSTCVDVNALSASELYEFMLNPTDSRYQRWWPGVHRRFHVIRRHPITSPVGDVVVMDELIGRRRLRFRGVVRVAEPDRRIVWQLGMGVSGPAWLEMTLTRIAGGVRIDHVVRIGFPGLRGRLTDPVIRLYFTDGFADGPRTSEQLSVTFPPARPDRSVGCESCGSSPSPTFTGTPRRCTSCCGSSPSSSPTSS